MDDEELEDRIFDDDSLMLLNFLNSMHENWILEFLLQNDWNKMDWSVEPVDILQTKKKVFFMIFIIDFYLPEYLATRLGTDPCDR